MTENEIRDHVQKLSSFYKLAYTLAIANFVFFTIWVLQGADHFWPIWPLFMSGLFLLLRANQFNIAPSRNSLNQYIENLCPCFREGWEEEQVKKMMAEHTVKAPKTSSKK